jgi:flagellar biosynthesis chaperone FliJ
MLTPERIEEIKRDAQEESETIYGNCSANITNIELLKLLATLEESQQQLAEEKKWRAVEHEVAGLYHRELVEAQQTIARQQEVLESARNTMEDALSVGEARYKDFDTRLCPWADLSDGVENIEAVLGNKEGSDKA